MNAGKRLVLFDFDGTLADSFAWFIRAINRLAVQYRFKPIVPEDLDRLQGFNSREVMAHLEFPVWRLPAIMARMRRLMRDSAAEIAPFAGVDRLLESLDAQGALLALVTSNSPENVATILGAANLRRIRFLECGASLFGKPARLRRVLRASGVAPAQAVCVGDEIRDAEAARAVGLDFIAVSWGYTHAEVLAPWSAQRPFATVEEMRLRLAEALAKVPEPLS